MSNSCKACRDSACQKPLATLEAGNDIGIPNISPPTTMNERIEQRIKNSKLRQQYYNRLTVLRHPKCSVQLSNPELEVLKLLSEGYSNQSMAALLSERKSIIDSSLLSMFNKLKANNRAEVIASASRLGFLAVS